MRVVHSPRSVVSKSVFALLLAPCSLRLRFRRGAAAEQSPPDRVLRLPLRRCRDSTEAFAGSARARYVEGKNIVIEWRFAEGKLERFPDLAAELVRLKVDVIVTGGPRNRAAREATSTIPIVMAQDSDPVGTGFVASLARPGGNVTGLSTLPPEISGKQLELLKETVPKLSRVAVLGSSNNPGNAQDVKRDGTRRKGVGSEASIPGRTESQGY